MNIFTGEHKFIIGVVFASIIIIIGGVAIASKAPGKVTLSQTIGVQMNLAETFHDWGDISKAKGLVSYSFKLQNTGSAPLMLANLKTSCMCTQVKLKTKSTESPLFGMHQVSSWKGAVEPGETAEIVVTYDPNAHGPTDLGRRERIVTFDTNDLNEPTAELRVSANVLQ